jgi:hypothetical protein
LIVASAASFGTAFVASRFKWIFVSTIERAVYWTTIQSTQLIDLIKFPEDGRNRDTKSSLAFRLTKLMIECIELLCRQLLSLNRSTRTIWHPTLSKN